MRFLPMFTRLSDIISNPTSNLTVAVLLLAMAIIVVLLVVVGLLYYAQSGPSSPKRRRRPRGAARPRPKGARPRAGKTAPGAKAVAASRVSETEYEYPELVPNEVGAQKTPGGRLGRILAGPAAIWVLVGMVVVALAYALTATSGDAFCAATCHAGQDPVVTRSKDVHKRVACASCHDRPAPGGLADAAVSHAVHSIANIYDAGAYAKPVSADSCLACHRDDISDTMTDTALSVRMSHKEPLAAGMVCTDCHPSMGHVESTATVGMSTCLRCHDGKTASAECPACHLGDTSRSIRRTTFTKRIFNQVDMVPPQKCGGCHSEKKCDACHGLRLPHPQKFIRWEHARYAGFEKRELCYRCHEPMDCTSGCHQPFSAHGPDFRAEHSRFQKPVSGGCMCHWVKLPADGQAEAKTFCGVCH